MHIETLLSEVSLTSGHGMHEIWRHLVRLELEGSVHATVTRLDRLAASLDPRGVSHGTPLDFCRPYVR